MFRGGIQERDLMGYWNTMVKSYTVGNCVCDVPKMRVFIWVYQSGTLNPAINDHMFYSSSNFDLRTNIFWLWLVTLHSLLARE